MQQLNICIVGLGGIGSCFAFQLARAGHTVSGVARAGSAREQQLQRDGAIRRSNVPDKEKEMPGAQSQPITVVHSLGATPYDAVIVTVLAHQLDAALLESLRTCGAKQIVLTGNRLDPQQTCDALGAARCVFGFPMQQAFVEADGAVHMAPAPASGQRTVLGDRRWVDIFNSAGMPSSFQEDMLLWLRCHLPVSMAFESACILAEQQQPAAGGLSWADACRVACAAQQGLALLVHTGCQLHPDRAQFASMPAFQLAGLLWGLTRDAAFRTLLAKAEVECRAMVDRLVHIGAECTFDTRLIQDIRPNDTQQDK